MKISEIISQYLLSKENNEELSQLEAWKDDATHNIEIIKDLDTVWLASEEMDNYQDYDTDKAWNALEQKNQANSSTDDGKKSPWLLLSVCLLLLVGLSYFVISSQDDSINTSEQNYYAASDTEIKAVQLKDQSQIWLNFSSELAQESDFTKTRTVNLEGQAYFDIHRDTQRPFIITTQNETVTVLGTAFDLNSYDGVFDLKVTEGLVSVNTGVRSIEVSANKRLVKDNGDYILLDHFDDKTLEWRFENLSFDNTPLSEVLNTLSQTYQVSFDNVKSLDLNNCLINTKFEDESLDDILDELAIISLLEVSKLDSNKYQILSVNCN